MSTQYNTIIVGAGSAGATMAAGLTEDPERSALLFAENKTKPSHARKSAPENFVRTRGPRS